ncbi:hypothetical protein TRIP_C30091 [Candidatus Zixiibacteriota bacterium]|nr:hypothetical protein TRIP_C30091 [candidate division Zixibacteria bacterium]
MNSRNYLLYSYVYAEDITGLYDSFGLMGNK